MLRSHHFNSAEDLGKTLHRFVWLYNHHLPQKALGHQAPVQALKVWKMKAPDLFVKNVRNHPEPDSYLDEQGIEKIRVDQRKGVLQLASKLQDKSGRDYVREGLALEGGDIYFSEVDLNIEHGVIEQPYQPMLRVVTRVVMDGQKAGLIVINARVEDLGRRLQMILGESHKLVVMNHDGGWIVGGAEKDWEFVLAPNDFNSCLSKISPLLWGKLKIVIPEDLSTRAIAMIIVGIVLICDPGSLQAG